MKLSRRNFIKITSACTASLGAATLLPGCNSSDSDNAAAQSSNKIAILSDVHFHDVYGDYDFADLAPIDASGRQVTMRSMNVSCRSTRMFNENYFVLHATLQQLGEQGVKYVCFSGDYSDDGQVDTIKGFKKVLEQYRERYGFVFLLAPGNHDCYPAGASQSKIFLDKEGRQVMVVDDRNTSSNPTDEGQSGEYRHVTPSMWGGSIEDMMTDLGDYGFRKQAHWLHYETPFGTSDAFSERQYWAINPDNNERALVGDASYLVEPEEGLWICMVDMNVFRPNGMGFKHDSRGWKQGIEPGYGKDYLMDWLKDVNQRAELLGKKLLLISHYPALNYLDGDGEVNDGHDVNYLLGDKSNTISRLPDSAVGDAFISCGLKLHFAGHMHVNDTYCYRNDQGHVFNVQVPSLSAYIPAYKLVTFHNRNDVEIDTVVVSDVPDFDALFPFYRQEIDQFEAQGKGDAVFWREMLEATDYRDLMRRHLMTLVRNRFFDSMAEDMKLLFQSNPSLYALMVTSQLPVPISATKALQASKQLEPHHSAAQVATAFIGKDATEEDYQAAIAATVQVENHIAQSGLSRQSFFNEDFQELLDLVYHLKNADELSLQDYGYERIPTYQVAMQLLATLQLAQHSESCSAEDFDCQLSVLQARLSAMHRVFELFVKADPSTHFRLNLVTGDILDLWVENPFRQ